MDLDFIHIGEKVGHDGRACLATAVALASLIPPLTKVLALSITNRSLYTSDTLPREPRIEASRYSQSLDFFSRQKS